MVALLAGCSTTTYKHGSTEISRTSFGVNLELGIVDIKDETGGAHIEQAKSDQTAAIQAAVQGAIQALATAVPKP